MAFINSILSLFTQKRLAQIDYFKANPLKVQRDTLQELLTQAANTEYGKKYNFNTILTAEQYRERLPIVYYEDISEYIQRMMEGEDNLLWPEEIKWFAKSSGTTNAKSKFIPVCFCQDGGSRNRHVFSISFDDTKVRHISIFFKSVAVNNNMLGT